MSNSDISVWALLQDDQFIKWVYSPDELTVAYWDKWVADHPEREALLGQAREIALKLGHMDGQEEAVKLAETIWTEIRGKIETNTENVLPLAPRHSVKKVWYWAAACLVGFALVGATIKYMQRQSLSAAAGATMQPVATLMVKENLQRTNQTNRDQEVWLVDDSRVVLQPGARIQHAAFFRKDKREVYLEGNAFFDVTPDPSRPFYVYTKDLVVQVLGTSFHVSTNKDNGDVTVQVKSGKIAVSKKASSSRNQLILETNERVLYKEQTHDLVQAGAGKTTTTSELFPVTAAISFKFEEAPVIEIFQTLEKAYGIPLHYDAKTFSSCKVTTSLADEPFVEKLKIVCEAIGADYKIAGDGVYIDGKPCKE